MSESEIKNQSQACYNQWCEQWRENARFHGNRFTMENMDDLANTGWGKAALCVANGYSFEENVETIKKYKSNIDIIACDKTIKHLIEHEIPVKYCVVCDANVSYETYLDPVKDKLQDTILIINVCANTKWATFGNWKKVYFFINEDVLGSHNEFQQLSNCPNIIVAATNVSSQMIVALTQSNNKAAQNHFGYDKYLMIGFDYSWGDESYYSFDRDGGGKVNYMRHVYLMNIGGDFCYTSTNLLFSARWFDGYIKKFKLPIFQCSKRSIVHGIDNAVHELENELKYRYRIEDSFLVQKYLKLKMGLMAQAREIDNKLSDIALDHAIAAM
jgi:hypothetical protein